MSWSRDRNTHRSGLPEGARYKRVHSAREGDRLGVDSNPAAEEALPPVPQSEQAELHLLGGRYT